MGGTVDSKPKAPLLEVVGSAEEKKPDAKAASATPGTASAALEIEEPVGVDAAVEQDGKEESEDNTKKKEGQAETLAQDGPPKTPFALTISLEIKAAFSAAFEGLGRLATAAYRRGTKLGKLMTGGITAPIHVVIDLLTGRLPKESPKGAASNATEGEVNSGPSLSVAGNAGGTSAQLKGMGETLNNEIEPAFFALQENSNEPPAAAATQSAQAASMPMAFKLGQKSAGSIVVAPADSGSVSPGAAVPIKKAAASTVKM